MKMFWLAGVVASLLMIGCQAGPIESEAGSEAAGDESSEGVVSEAEQEIKIGDYYDPPRCGPRNCVAWCVTCEYDICRISGGSIADCKAEMELCKLDCY